MPFHSFVSYIWPSKSKIVNNGPNPKVGHFFKLMIKALEIFNMIDEVVLVYGFSTDGPTMIITANAKATEVLGYSEHEFSHLHPFDLGDPDLADNHKGLTEEMNLTRKLVFRENLLHKKGHRIPFEMRSQVVTVDGVELVVTICKNITEYLEETLNIKALYNELEFFFESMPNFIFILDKEFKFQYVNKTLCLKLGITKDDIIGKHWNFLFLSEVTSLDDIKQKLKTNSQAICHSPMRLKDGGKLHVETTLRVSTWKGVEMIGGSSYDLTNTNLINQQLVDSEAKYRSLFESLPTPIVIISEGKPVFGNPALEKVSGYTIDEIIKKPFLEFIHPSEQSKLLTNYVQGLKGVANVPEVYETIGVNKKGEAKYLRVKPLPFTHLGKPAIMAILEDFSDIKQAKAQLLEKQVLFSAIVDNQNEGVIITDLLDNITYSNTSANSIFGFRNHDGLTGKSIHKFLNQSNSNIFNTEKQRTEALKSNKYNISITNAHHNQIISEVFGTILKNADGSTSLLSIFRDITDEIRILSELEESKSSLEAVIHGSQVGIWKWNIKTGKTVFSERWANLIGYTLAELGETNIDTWVKFSHPDDLPTSQIALEKHFRGETELYESIVRMKHKDGRWIWIQDRGKVVEWDSKGEPLVASGIHHDITELVQINLKLEQRYFFEKIVSEISAELINISEDALDEVINRTLARIGHASSVDRSYIFQFNDDISSMTNTHEWCAPGINPEIENLQDLPTSIFPYTMKTLGDNQVLNIQRVADLPPEAQSEKEILQAQDIVSMMIVPLYGESKLLGYMGFDSVVDEKVWNENDIDLLKTVANDIANAITAIDSKHKLNLALEKAQESDRLKSAFLATMNHELRTPLNHIIGFSDIIASMSSEDEIIQFSKIINNSGKNLLEIIEDVFDLALAEQSKIKIRKQTFNGIDIFMENKISLEEILSNLGKTDQIKLLYKPQKELLSLYLTSDRTKISQVLTNLFKNAIKFTDSGEIEFGFNLTDDGLISFYVRDTGIGIPIEKQGIIFEFFRQADDSHTRKHDGVGIGLAISQKIANALDGRIHMKSQVGVGSTFYFDIPIEVTETNSGIKAINNEQNQYDFSDKTIIVAEDDDDSMKLIKIILKSTGCRVIDVDDGLKAYRAFVSNPKADLVILDLKMPEMDGFTAAQKIRTHNKTIPIIALSSYSLLKDKDKATASGCDILVSKPVNKGILLAEMAKRF